MTRIFDIMAELCSFVMNSCKDRSTYLKYSCISDSAHKKILDEIHERLPVLFKEGEDMSVNILDKNDLTPELYRLLDAYTSELYIRCDFFQMIGLIQVLDEGLESILLGIIEELQEQRFNVVLNTNRETTGIGLLPRCSCVWERHHRMSRNYNRLDNYLFHLLIIENSVIGELFDIHHFLKPETFPNFREAHHLKISVSPLSIDRPFGLEEFEQNSIQYFRIVYNKNDYNKDNELIWQKICESAKHSCDIVVFPELLGNPDTKMFISSRLSLLSREEQRKIPALIVLPSVYENGLNSAYILGRNGKEVCRQSKQHPFRSVSGNKAQLEAIKTNQVINILHYEGIGRIAVLICRDFLTTEYMEKIMRCFKLTLIIVPSFSTGSYDFRQSFDLCAHDDCNVVWINSCAAMSKGKEANFENIGYVRKRIGRGDDDSQKLCKMPVCEGIFSGNCSKDCIYFETIRGL